MQATQYGIAGAFSRTDESIQPGQASITCPKCGTENSANAVNCRNCRINLKSALGHLDETELAEPRAVQGTPDKAMSHKQARKKKGLTYLLVAVACFVGYFLVYTAGGGGLFGGGLAVATLICFVVGVIYLIGGFVGKE